jgi:hypothetical protein
MTTRNKLFGATLLFAALTGSVAPAQELRVPRTNWRSLGLSIAAHWAASGFDAWTSWQRVERNGFLANGGRFTAQSAYRKAEMFAGVAVVEALVVKKWGGRHPWVARACRIGNFSAAGMLFSAGVRNLRSR